MNDALFKLRSKPDNDSHLPERPVFLFARSFVLQKILAHEKRALVALDVQNNPAAGYIPCIQAAHIDAICQRDGITVPALDPYFANVITGNRFSDLITTLVIQRDTGIVTVRFCRNVFRSVSG